MYDFHWPPLENTNMPIVNLRLEKDIVEFYKLISKISGVPFKKILKVILAYNIVSRDSYEKEISDEKKHIDVSTGKKKSSIQKKTTGSKKVSRKRT